MAEQITSPGIPDIIVLNFADSKIPIFKETRNRDYIEYGEDNLYSDYLTHLYNKSAKHNAIINGKSNYIFGKGYENGDVVVNRLGMSLNDISKRCILDRTIYGGFKLEVIWGFNNKISEIYHVDFNCLRKGKEGGFYFKESWNKKICKDDARFIPGFDPFEPGGSQIFEYNEYRPGIRFYPLPDYIGANNYIETDIEISKYYLSAIRNGMMPSKMVQIFQGNLTDEKKGEIERRWKAKFAGSENAGKFVLVFSDNKEMGVDITDLSATDLDKHFKELNETAQQEIFSGHSVTNPSLFGIMEKGKLGGTGGQDIKVSYATFQNTYSKPKAKDFDKEINWLLSYSNFSGVYELKATDPIGTVIDTKDALQYLPIKFILQNAGVPEEMWNEPLAGGTPPASTVAAPEMAGVNDTLKNLTGRQLQNIMRIVRQYDEGRGKVTRPQAEALLKAGYGLTDDEIQSFLGDPVPVQMSFNSDDEIIGVFDSFGESKNDFEIIKSKKVCFEINEFEQDEIEYKQAFLRYDITPTQNRILELIKKDPLITSEVISKTIGETVAFVERNLKSLAGKGFLETTIEKVGVDEIIKRAIPKDSNIIAPPSKAKVDPTRIFIKYSYEGPEDNRNRPFCAKLLQLNRLYSRYDIEKISQRLGYSVFDRAGGWWNKGNGVISPSCRHSWKSNIVIQKGGENVN